MAEEKELPSLGSRQTVYWRVVGTTEWMAYEYVVSQALLDRLAPPKAGAFVAWARRALTEGRP